MQLYLFSFITFPQILFDGFQAEPANYTNANLSLPSFEFVDVLTADVSSSFSSHCAAFLKFLRVAPEFSTIGKQIEKNTQKAG